MPSDNVQSAVTYTSISSDSDTPSWVIPLMNANEFPEMHLHVLEPEHPKYHAPSNDDIQVEDEDEVLEEDPSEEHEPTDDDEDPEEGSYGARISVRPQTHMAASNKALTDAFAAGSSLFPLPPTSPTYDQAPLGHRAAMICMRDDISKEDIPPRRRFSFTAPPPSPGHGARTITRASDREEDVGYVKALQASEHRMMTSIKEVNLRVSYQAQVHRQEMRGQRTVYEIELQEVHRAYLSSEARNRVLLARLETLETHVSRMEWQRQSAKDLAVTQMMRIHALEARARTDMVQDADSSC
nr:hypothetical protein [Tanacetum cinerariifolium]